MATNYTSLTTAQQIMKRKHTCENQLNDSNQETLVTHKLKKYLTKSVDQFRSCQAGYGQQYPKTTSHNTSKVTEKLQKQYASFVGS